MMYRFAILLFCLFALSSNQPGMPAPNPSEVLQLKWNKAYSHETIDKAALGLEWTLSFLGAILPNSPSGIVVKANQISINATELGFDTNALQKIKQLHRKIKDSDEYKRTGAIDLGRYVTLLIGSSEHYYAITGIPKRFDALVSKYSLLPQKGYVNNSSVSHQHRIIRFSEPDKFNQLLVATEIDSLTKVPVEFETIEIMANGQLRFGIFDADGNLKNSAASSHSEAGKPAKCMWCHESTIQRMYNKQHDVDLHLTYQQLQDQLILYNQYLTDHKTKLTTGVKFTELQQHTLSELLYISFMEPSAERLALEWSLPLAEVQLLLSELPTHIYQEFPFLGNLYHRNDVEKLAPFQGLQVSGNVREGSEMEVNHLSE